MQDEVAKQYKNTDDSFWSPVLSNDTFEPVTYIYKHIARMSLHLHLKQIKEEDTLLPLEIILYLAC